MSERFRERIQVTNSPTHHFFVGDPRAGFRPLLCDASGKKVLVFTNRDKAEKVAVEKLGLGAFFAIVGMGDEKWRLFQAEEQFLLVD